MARCVSSEEMLFGRVFTQSPRRDPYAEFKAIAPVLVHDHQHTAFMIVELRHKVIRKNSIE
ncbi:MAG: hypothetical protein ACOC0P_06195 [Planctomycetota bacterium]